jgi:hypothetical protein
VFGRARGKRLVSNAVLSAFAVACALIAVVREQFVAESVSMAMAMSSDVVPVAAAQALVALKAVLATIVVLGALAWACRRFRRSGLVASVAALPPWRSSVVVGATIAAGLAMFDACTRYHGAAMDTSGSCYCWVTGMLAAAGAGIVSLSIVAGRAVVAYCRRVVRVIIDLVVRLRHTIAFAAFRSRRARTGALRRRWSRARRCAGRAPPSLA